MRALASALLLSGLVCGADAAAAAPVKLLVFGVDGGDREVLELCIRAGRCPNLKAHANASLRADIFSLRGELSSPVIWTTIATGRPSGQHGVLPLEASAPGARSVKAFWNIFGEAGWKVGVFGWLATSAKETVNGVLVAGDGWGRAELTANPPQAVDADALYRGLSAAQGAAAVMSKFCEPKRCRPFIEKSRARGESRLPGGHDESIDHLAVIYRRDEATVRAAEQVLARGETDLAAAYVQGFDAASHLYHLYLDPAWREVSLEEREALGDIVMSYLAQVDAWFGRLARFAGPESTVLVLSDHGVAPPHFLAEPSIRGAHRDAGLFLMRSRHAETRAGGARLSTTEVLPLLLYLHGLPIAHDMAGALRHQFVDARELTRRPASFVASYESSRRDPASSAEESKRAFEMLRAFGYLR